MTRLFLSEMALVPEQTVVLERWSAAQQRSDRWVAQIQNVGRRLLHRGAVEGTVVIADQGLSSMMNFLIGVFVARTCVEATYGSFVLCLTGARFLVGVQNSVITVPYAIHYPRLDGKCARVFLGSSLISQLVVSVGTAGLCLIAAAFAYFGDAQKSLLNLLLVMVVTTFVLMTKDFVRGILLAQLRVWETLWLGVCVNGLTIVLLGAAYFGRWTGAPHTLFLMAVGSGIPTTISLVRWLWPDSTVVVRALWRDFLVSWEQGRWLAIRSFLYLGTASVYPFLIGLFDDKAQVAAYGACFALSSLINPLFAGVTDYLRPKLCHILTTDPRGLRRCIRTALCLLGVASALLLMVTALWGNQLIVVIYGQRYRGLGLCLLILVISVCLSVIEIPFLLANEAFKNTKATFLARALGTLCTATVGVAMIYFWGLIGAVIARCLSFALSLAYTMFAYSNRRITVR